MRILHITPHLGGGVGTVIMDWLRKDLKHDHQMVSLDYVNKKAIGTGLAFIPPGRIELAIHLADIVLVHYWDHPMLAELFSKRIPDCRMVFWCHKNFDINNFEIEYPDRFINTSPVQNYLALRDPIEYIWSTGNMERFLAIEPKPHEGFNIGYIGTIDFKKMHGSFVEICEDIKKAIPEARFTIVGEDNIWVGNGSKVLGDHFTFTGKVNDVAPYLAEMDVFAYPLRPDHYGTCEIALGEAMASGVVPVVMDGPAMRWICGPVGAKSEKEFIRMVEILYKLPEFRKELSVMVRNTARKRYNIDNMIASWNQIFTEMMQNPKTKRSPI